MPNRFPLLSVARTALRILIGLNWLFGATVLFLLIATVVSGPWTLAALKLAPTALVGVRAIALLGVVSVPLNRALLMRLLAIVETVTAGDPFIAANAQRLQGIAWALLALQVLSVVIGAIGKAVSTPAHPLHFDAGFSISGWLAVILTFILARVFAEGTLMRDDLEGTV